MDAAFKKSDEAQLEGADPYDVLAWAAARFAPRLAFAFGFGPEGCVLLDLIGRHRLDVDVFTLDTGLLFPETHALWRRLEQRYGLVIRSVPPVESVDAQARTYGDRLWERDPDRCCDLRKVQPLALALRGHDAWISAIRREQTPLRARARVASATASTAWSRSIRWPAGRAHRCGTTSPRTTSP